MHFFCDARDDDIAPFFFASGVDACLVFDGLCERDESDGVKSFGQAYGWFFGICNFDDGFCSFFAACGYERQKEYNEK